MRDIEYGLALAPWLAFIGGIVVCQLLGVLDDRRMRSRRRARVESDARRGRAYPRSRSFSVK